MKNQTFTMTIEIAGRPQAIRHPYHLGTDEAVARQICLEKFEHGEVYHEGENHRIVTVGLHVGGELLDVIDGSGWDSENDLWDDFTGAHE